MEFNVNLRSARESCGFTQQQVADKMGISKSTYCGYEIGKRQPDVEKIKQLAQIFHVTGSYLIGLEDSDFGNANKKAPSVSDEAMEVAEAYDDADLGIQYSIRKLLDLEVPEIKMVARGNRVKRTGGKPKVKEIDEAISETTSET